ncbi:MAG: hypothetical protein SO373_05420 [Candidatus Borkfalkiaceae bacterium]|nr:hypothetical protein [Christensenellaceae bacterium]
MREIISVILVMISVAIVFSGCGRKISNYSIEEYIQRISEKVFLQKLNVYIMQVGIDQWGNI